MARESYNRRYVELHAMKRQAVCHREPVIQMQHQADMRHQHFMVADFAGAGSWKRNTFVKRNLVTEEIVIHISFTRAAFFAAENVTVEVTRCFEVCNMV